jgi:tRNA(Ile)-lysidine synthase
MTQQSGSTSLPQTAKRFFASRGIADGALMLVAFSAGADSTALLSALVKAGYRCRALHCNFHLRGEESDRDEAVARAIAHELGCEIAVTHFDVAARQRATGESIEMACRALRYEWFTQMYSEAECNGEQPACVAVGHHQSDNIETFFLNALRGSGLKGVAAIAPQRDIFMRPLLNVSKRDIEQYIQHQGLSYVVDSSNLENDYKRNRVRNIVLPTLTEAFPNAQKGLSNTIANLRRDSDLLSALIDNVRTDVTTSNGGIDLTRVFSMPQSDTLLFHILNEAIPLADVQQILKAYAAGESGRRFNGANVSYLLNRGTLLPVTNSTVTTDTKPEISATVLPIALFKPTRCNDTIWLDGSAAETIMADWQLRLWKFGDRIKPFGLNGSKLVSDILTDAKLSAIEKECQWVLTYRNEVVWVVGLRASRLFTVDKKSETVIMLHINK